MYRTRDARGEYVKLTYQPEQEHYVGAIVTGYNESPTPNNGLFRSVGCTESGSHLFR